MRLCKQADKDIHFLHRNVLFYPLNLTASFSLIAESKSVCFIIEVNVTVPKRALSESLLLRADVHF